MLLHVEEQIVDFALLTSFDSDYNSWMAISKLLTRFNWKDCAEKRVTIVIRASAKHDAILDDWITRVCVPTLPIRLLVHVTIHEDSLVLCLRGCPCLGCNIDDKERASARLLKRLYCDAINILGACESDEMIHLSEQVSICFPLWVKDGWQGRNTDEFYKER